MAAIRNSISLQDRFTPTLRAVTRAMQSTLRVMNQVNTSMASVDSRAFNTAQRDVQRASNALMQLRNHSDLARNSLRDCGDEGSRGAGRLRNALTGAGDSMSSAGGRAKQLWNNLASGIYVIKNIISAISSMTEYVDKAISSMAKLNLQNYSGLTQAQGYGLAYQAAQNSRSDLEATSNLASGIAMSGVYGSQQGSLEKSIKMAETLQKALVVGGGTSEENERALTQLRQGLSSGVLQGDELRSLREQAPYLAQTLAEGLAKVDDKFIGTTIGDLKELGSEGELTADTVIKAFEAMRDEVDEAFDTKAPKTWAQGVESISNTVSYVIGLLQQMEDGPLQKISGLVWQIAEFLQSSDGLKLMSIVATGLGIIGQLLSWVLGLALKAVSWCVNHIQAIASALAVLAAIAAVFFVWFMAGWVMANWPILLVIAAVVLLILIFDKLGITFSQVVGGICGGVMVILAFFKNLGLAIAGVCLGLWAVILALANNTGLSFQNVGLGIQAFFAGIASTVLGFIAKIAAALNKLPFISFDYSGLTSLANDYADKQAAANAQIDANNAQKQDIGAAFLDAYNSMGAFSDGWASDAYDTGYDWGSGLAGSLGDFASNISSTLTDGFNFDSLSLDALSAGSTGIDNVSVDGGDLDSVGSIGSDVDISDEDVKLLRDMAARDYLLQLQSVTPVAHVTFGDVRETADVNKIMDIIEEMVDEQMATALVS